MSRLAILTFLFVTCCCACAVPFEDDTQSSENELRKTIYLVSHGWHAGIVLQRSDVPANVLQVVADFPDVKYLEVGWGDRDFYQTPDPHIGITLKAALLPTASVLHIVGFDADPQTFFPHSEIIEIRLASNSFDSLLHSIAESFAMDARDKTQPLGAGLYGKSRFYLSWESYHLFNTCNVWVARILHSAGLPISPIRSITVENLMSQARPLGTRVQAQSTASE